jgi:hypothetical protein
MKKVLDSVTLFGHVFAMLEKWASNLPANRLTKAGRVFARPLILNEPPMPTLDARALLV